LLAKWVYRLVFLKKIPDPPTHSTMKKKNLKKNMGLSLPPSTCQMKEKNKT